MSAPAPLLRRIVFGSDHDFPPYEYLDRDGSPVGFNVDLIRAVGEAMGLDVVIELGPWQDMRRALEVEGRTDVSDMYHSELRAEAVDFTVPFAIMHDVIYVRRGTRGIETLDDLHGREVIVERGSYTQEYVLAQATDVAVIPVESEPAALRLLAAGRHDCALVAPTTARATIRRSGLTNLIPAGPPLLARDYCFVVAKGRTDLLDALNQGLAIVKATGRFSEIDERWFGESETAGLPLQLLLRWGGLAAAGLSVVFVVILAWGWTMRRQVAQRTRELQAELAERLRAEEALRKQESLLRTVIETLPVGVWVTDPNGSMISANQAGEALWGGVRFADVGDFHDFPAWWADTGKRLEPQNWAATRALRDGETSLGEVLEIELPDRERKTILSSAVPIRGRDGEVAGAVVLNQDITHARNLEAQLQHSQKMEAVGLLAGGVAHDFNNVLQAIVGYCEILSKGAMIGETERGALRGIGEATESAAGLSRKLLAFSRKQVLRPQILSLNAVTRKIEVMLRRVLTETIEVRVSFATDPPTVRADPSQLEQVILNLALNARDAMPGGGTLTIATGQAEVANDLAAAAGGIEPGPYAVLTVSDTGHGMDREIASRIFEPFFTTKEMGKGTGLGLATVYGIVRQSGGGITVESEPGAGATFKVFLPRRDEPPDAQQPSEAIVHPGSGDETILLVEDEPHVRRAIQQMLESFGYRVLVAANPDQAMRLEEAHQEPIRLLLTDVVMPGLDGWTLAERLLASRPTMRVVFMSGYAPGTLPSAATRAGTPRVLLKPFTPNELAAEVRRALDSPPGERSRSGAPGR